MSYGQSKAAATHMGKQLSTNLAPYKIRVNVICPGMFPTEMTESILPQGKDPCVEGNVPTSLSPLGRYGSEEDMAGLILYLVSRAGTYVDGCVQVADGGRLAQIPSTY